MEKPTEVIASIKQFIEEKEEVPVDLSAIEVEKKGKVEEEGAAPTTAEGGDGIPTPTEQGVGKAQKSEKKEK